MEYYIYFTTLQLVAWERRVEGEREREREGEREGKREREENKEEDTV